jgi:NDP-sugar pyrophosphorylase family protein
LPVNGVPLLEHVVLNFEAARITTIAIIFNEEFRECEKWVRARFPHLDLRIRIKTTRSSLESFFEVLGMLEPGRVLVSTVDAWCPRPQFRTFAEAAATSEGTVLAVTPLVADEKPLWVTRGPDGRIVRIGGESGDAVTAGMYAVGEDVRSIAPPPHLGRLREFLSWLVERGEIVGSVALASVVDVDRTQDVRLAESISLEAR